jgi:hypothetical protein
MNPLNSPIEIGMRILAILESAYPASIDVDRLMLLDHSMVHSSDFGGPHSLHPDTPERESEIGVRRQSIEGGLNVMLRAGLAEIELSNEGIRYRASDEAYSFIRLLESSYVTDLRHNARWAVREFSQIDDQRLKQEVRSLTNRWAETDR